MATMLGSHELRSQFTALFATEKETQQWVRFGLTLGVLDAVAEALRAGGGFDLAEGPLFGKGSLSGENSFRLWVRTYPCL